MFNRERVIAALEAKADRFAGYEVDLSDTLAAYEQTLAELANLSRDEIEARLAGMTWPGARPTAEHDKYPDLVVPFTQTWTNHQQARAWARDALSDVPTVAVDGSQNVYVTGETKADDFPTSEGAYDRSFNAGTHDAFVARLATLSESHYIYLPVTLLNY